MQPTSAAAVERAVAIVSADLERQGWDITRREASGLVKAGQGPRSLVLLVRVALYPDAWGDTEPGQPTIAPSATRGSEVWMADVQVTRDLAPIFTPRYRRLDVEAPSTTAAVRRAVGQG